MNPNWLWPGRVGLGGLTSFVGPGSVGKGSVFADVLARITTGSAWPDAPACQDAGSVLWIGSEDGLRDTLKPRLMACGADITKVKPCCTLQGGQWLDLDRHMEAIENTIVDMGDCKAVGFDPIGAFLGAKVNENYDGEVRPILNQLKAMAERQQVAMLFVRHFNKARDVPVVNRIVGARVFVDAPRSVWAIHRDGNMSYLLPVKRNIGTWTKGLMFTVERHGQFEESKRVMWLGACDGDADDWINSPSRHNAAAKLPRASKLDEAVAWLNQYEELKANDVHQLAEEAGIKRPTLDRAKTVAGWRSERREEDGQQCWVWVRPTTPSPVA